MPNGGLDPEPHGRCWCCGRNYVCSECNSMGGGFLIRDICTNCRKKYPFELIEKLENKLDRLEAEKVTEFERGLAEGRAKQAILECQARDKFIDELKGKLCKKCRTQALQGQKGE